MTTATTTAPVTAPKPTKTTKAGPDTSTSVRPLDPRLLRYARVSLVGLAALVVLGTLAALLVVAQAQLIADAITGVGVDGAIGRTLAALAVVIGLRAVVAWGTEVAGHAAAAAVKSTLRRRLVEHATRLGPRWLSGARSAELATLATRGIDALDGYFARYLPQLVLAVIAPTVVGGWILLHDWIAAVTIAVTLPLIPIFMILVGLVTRVHTRRRWRALAQLSHHFLDVVAGLPTLKVFGRARAQAASIRAVTTEYRVATMRTLRIAFLSSLVLELLATLSVALVAVGIGLRLVDGSLDLRTALVVLILAPEAYLPLRAVGTHFHASADGLAAAEEVFTVLETPPRPGTHHTALRTEPDSDTDHTPNGAGTAAGMGISDFGTVMAVQVRDLRVTHPDREGAAPDGVSLTLRPGRIVAVAGPSGRGKSTLLSVLLGFTPYTGQVIVETTRGRFELTDLDPDAWRRMVGWVPQDPVLIPGTVAEAISLGSPDASWLQVLAAARDAALGETDLSRQIGERGGGLSAGERRRVAVARAFLRQAPILLLDEPTAGLDPLAEAWVLSRLRASAEAGHMVLVVAHRPAVLHIADEVIHL